MMSSSHEKKRKNGFTALEKTADFNRWLSPIEADCGAKPPSKQTNGERSSLKGFTLIELIMTITVAGLIAVPLSLSLTAQVQGMVKSGILTTALNLARLEMEKVNNLAYAGISSASFSHYQGYPYDVTRAVTYAQGNAGSAESLKQITVSVTEAGSATVLASLTTYIAKNVIYAS